MSWQIYLLITIMLIIYIYSYYKYPKNTYIIQSHIRMFKPEILFNKQPLIIDDNDYNMKQLKSVYFNINISQEFTITSNETWNKNKYKYIIIQATNGPCDLLLCNPNNIDKTKNIPYDSVDTEIVEVQLSQGQIIIIPFNWLYLIVDSTVDCIGLHDLITYFLP